MFPNFKRQFKNKADWFVCYFQLIHMVAAHCVSTLFFCFYYQNHNITLMPTAKNNFELTEE